MKNKLLTLMFLIMTTFGYGQFLANYSATNISGPFDNGEEVAVDWAYSANGGTAVTVHARFELVLDGTVEDTQNLGDNYVSGFESGTFVYTFGSGCDFDSDDYDLNLVVYFSHQFATNRSVSINYNMNGYCDGYIIPGTGADGPECDVPIFTDQLFTGGCCEAVNLELDSYTSPWQKGRVPPCDVLVFFNVSGLPLGTPYTTVWNDGFGGLTRFFDCGTETFTVTISWISIDGTNCSASATGTYSSNCYCPHIDIGSSSLLVEENDDWQVIEKTEIYPNPSDGAINVKLPGKSEVTQIQVFNTLGQLEQTFNGSFEGSNKFTLENVNVGLRYIRLTHSNGNSEIVQLMIQ